MKKKITLIVICTIMGSIVYGQKTVSDSIDKSSETQNLIQSWSVTINGKKYVYDSPEIFLTKFQNVAFVTSDSIYEFTRFIKPNGEFYFRERFTDTTNWDEGLLYGSPDLITPPGVYRLLYENTFTTVDTIYSYLPIRNIEYSKDFSIINIHDELEYSYILKQIGETDKISSENNAIRILVPCKDSNSCTSYNIITIRFFTDSAKLYSIAARSVDHNGIQLVRKDSCLLTQKEIKKITEQLTASKTTSELTCRRPGNPWILEYNYRSEYKRFIISLHCFAGERSGIISDYYLSERSLSESSRKDNRNDNLNLRPIWLLYSLTTSASYKYFGSGCRF